MTAFLVRRVLQTLLALLGVSVIVFALIHLVPGDPVRTALGTRFDQDIYDALVERNGLDQPVVTQYASWLGSAVTGDLGVSFRDGRPVTDLVVERLPATLTLAAAALVVALVVALPLGVVSAMRSGSKLDYTATAASQVGISVPDFWAGIIYILLFSLAWRLLPPSNYVSPTESVVEWLRHLVLPAATVGLVSASILFRFVRSAVLEAASEDYVRTARAKGVSEWRVLRDHILPNAWVAIVTVVGLQLGFLLGGVVVVEVIFNWPGIGRLALIAVERRDFTLLQGTVLWIALMFLVVNLVVDLLYAALDPRIRYR